MIRDLSTCRDFLHLKSRRINSQGYCIDDPAVKAAKKAKKTGFKEVLRS
jgi:hypothetical protein